MLARLLLEAARALVVLMTALEEDETRASIDDGRPKEAEDACIVVKTPSSTLSDLPSGALDARRARGWIIQAREHC